MENETLKINVEAPKETLNTDFNPAPDTSNLKNLTWITYACFLLSFFSGVGFLIGMIIAYLKRDDANGTIYRSHFDYLISTAWWTLIIGGIGVLTIFVMVGFVILFFLGFWVLYRVIKGMLKLSDNKPVAI